MPETKQEPDPAIAAFEERMKKRQEAEDMAEELRKEQEKEKLRAAYMRRRGLL